MMKYIVHLRQKRHGKIEVEAETSQEATGKVKRLIHMDRLPKGTMDEESRIVIAFTEEI
jgi:hypothetical protein